MLSQSTDHYQDMHDHVLMYLLLDLLQLAYRGIE